MMDTYKKISRRAFRYTSRWLKSDNFLLGVVAGAGVIIISLLAFLSVFDRPIADDYAWIYQAHTMTIRGYMHQQLWYTYGRYGNALALALLGKFFYTASVIVAPLMLILFLVASAYYMTSAFGAKRLRALGLSLIITALLLTSVPSIFDTLYWMNSSTLYPLALAGSMLVAGTTVKIWTAHKLAIGKVIAAVLVAFLAGGVNEFAPLINILIIAAICVAWQGTQYAWKRYAIGALFVSQLLAFSILKWAPGSVHRQTLQQSGADSLFHLAKHSLLILFNFFPTLSNWNTLLIIFASVLIALTFYTPENARVLSKYVWYRVVALLTLATALLIVPVLTTQYAHSIRENGQPPFRAQTYMIAGLMLALATIIWLTFALLKLRNVIYKNWALLIVLGFVVALSIGRVVSVGKALTSRAFLYDQRTTMTNLQIKSGKDILSLPEVPIYAVSDSQDLPPTNDPNYVSSWVSVVMAEYLGVKQVKTDNTRGLQGCPTVGNQYDNQDYCDSVYKSVTR